MKTRLPIKPLIDLIEQRGLLNNMVLAKLRTEHPDRQLIQLPYSDNVDLVIGNRSLNLRHVRGQPSIADMKPILSSFNEIVSRINFESADQLRIYARQGSFVPSDVRELSELVIGDSRSKDGASEVSSASLRVSYPVSRGILQIAVLLGSLGAAAFPPNTISVKSDYVFKKFDKVDRNEWYVV